MLRTRWFRKPGGEPFELIFGPEGIASNGVADQLDYKYGTLALNGKRVTANSSGYIIPQMIDAAIANSDSSVGGRGGTRDEAIVVTGVPTAASTPAAAPSTSAGGIPDLCRQVQDLTVSVGQQSDKFDRFMSDHSSTTVDASRVTTDDIDQIDQALNVTRWAQSTVSFETMKSDEIQYAWLTHSEDSKQQMLEVEAFLSKNLLANGLDVSFCLVNVNHSNASSFPRATFSGVPRHYRGKADYLILNSKYRGLKDAVLQRRAALVGFELKKDLSTQEEASYMAQARLGFFSYGAQSNAALLYVLTDLVKGGVMFWAKRREHDELQVFEHAVSGMKELFTFVRTALEAAPIVSMEEAAKERARSCTYQDTKTLKSPDRDRFRILGYQHPRQLPGQLLMKAEDKADSTDDQDISAWYPDEGLKDPVVYPVKKPAPSGMYL